MFRLSSRRQREYLATADDSTRRSKVRSYLKKISPTDLSARPLRQYDEAFDPAQWGPKGLRRSEHIDIRFIPSLPSSGRTSCDSSVSCPTSPLSPAPPMKRTIRNVSSFPSTAWKGKARERIPDKEEKEDMIEMTIHHQHQNKIVILIDAIFWKTSPSSRNYQQVPVADISLALELFQECDKTQSSHWWMLAQAASRETAMRYSFTENGIRIDYIRNSKNVRFSSEESPIHIYEQIWIDEDDDLEWERHDQAAYYEEDEDTDDSDVLSVPPRVDEATMPTRNKLKLISRMFSHNSKIKIIPPSPSESSISGSSIENQL